MIGTTPGPRGATRRNVPWPHWRSVRAGYLVGSPVGAGTNVGQGGVAQPTVTLLV
jgi:hypothetical protein